MRQLLSGNEAAAVAVRLARPHVIPTYPVTPQAPLLAHLARDVAAGRLESKFLNMESDQSAIAAAVGASLGGARVFTASSSQGLAYMHEHLFYASGLRLPIVMAVVTRALSAPHCRFADHNDALAQSTTGWIQLFCEDAQEILDNCLMLFRLCEHSQVLLPAMACYEAYVHSHTWEAVEVPNEDKVASFLPAPTVSWTVLDPDQPRTVNPATPERFYMEARYRQAEAMRNSADVLETIVSEFREFFGRDYHGLVETWPDGDAEIFVVAMGSIVRTARGAVRRLREEGTRAAVLKVRAYRPFPALEVRRLLQGARAVVVIDRDNIPGGDAALHLAVRAALYGVASPPRVLGFVAGLGGRDVTIGQILQVVEQAMAGGARGWDIEREGWIGLRNG